MFKKLAEIVHLNYVRKRDMQVGSHNLSAEGRFSILGFVSYEQEALGLHLEYRPSLSLHNNISIKFNPVPRGCHCIKC